MLGTAFGLFDPQKKKEKKFEIFEKSQNFEKNIIFLKVYPFCTIIGELDICSFIYANNSIKKYFIHFQAALL